MFIVHILILETRFALFALLAVWSLVAASRRTRSRVTGRRHVSRGHVSRHGDTCNEVTCHGLIVPHAVLFYSEIFQDHYNASSFPRPSEFSRGIGENSHQKSEIICHELARCQFSPLIKFWHGI